MAACDIWRKNNNDVSRYLDERTPVVAFDYRGIGRMYRWWMAIWHD
jgi:hypothetical protein